MVFLSFLSSSHIVSCYVTLTTRLFFFLFARCMSFLVPHISHCATPKGKGKQSKMGKGGQTDKVPQEHVVKTNVKEEKLKQFVTQALDGKREAFEVPSKYPEMSEVMAAIPEKCFEKSTPLSMFYALLSTSMVVAAGYIACTFFPSPSLEPVSFLLWYCTLYQVSP